MLIAAWREFIGAVPKMDPKRLPEGFGVTASNLRPGFADLRGWPDATTVVNLGSGTYNSAYRMNAAVISDTADWIQWSGDVDVVRSLIASDTTEEIYYAGGAATEPRRTDNVLGLPSIPGPAAYRTLGIPAPATAMTAVVLVAGSGASESRVYFDTYVNNQGRESAPGQTRTLTCLGGSTATLASLAAVPGGHADITLRRIYCSTDGGDYLEVKQIAVGLTSTTDDLARGAICQSGGDDNKPSWLEPPTTLVGLIELWNGMIGGFFGKSRAVCVPWKPWAWPVEYQEATYHDIVGTGKWLQNWLVLTTANPVLITGSSPESMNEQPLPFNWACVAKKSIVGLGHGVAWASQNGLAYMGQNGPRMLTEGILSPEQWQALVPGTMICSMVESYVYCSYDDGTRKAFLIDPLNPLGIINLTQGCIGRYYDKLADRLYLLQPSGVIKRWGAGSALATTFKTGIARSPFITSPAYALIVADTPISCAFTLWANTLQPAGTHAWTQVFTRTVVSGQAFAMPGGYLSREFQAQLVTTGPVQALLLAEDVEDLL